MSDFDARAREIACDWHDCPKGLYAKHSLGCDELASAISSALKEAVEEEREACARLCAPGKGWHPSVLHGEGHRSACLNVAREIAASIRNREET